MLLKELLIESDEIRHRHLRNFDFLPKFNVQQSLPINPQQSSWAKTSDTEKNYFFDRISDLQDFVNCYFELILERSMQPDLVINDLQVTVKLPQQIDKRFKSMIDEIANETRGS